MAMLSVTDQMGRKVEIAFPPQRIVSLVPSQTEFLADIGLGDKLVGITRFCVHPASSLPNAVRIGGTKQFDVEKIEALRPHLIIGNKEENYEEGINSLSEVAPVWMSDICSLKDAFNMMLNLGLITDKSAAAVQVVEEIKAALPVLPVAATLPKAAYFIWCKPYMVAAAGTFINEMMRLFGVRNAFEHLTRYPTLQEPAITAAGADYVFLSSEPYRFTERHLDEFRQLAPAAKVILIDGEMFSWYGSRLRYAAGYFAQLRQQLGLVRC